MRVGLIADTHIPEAGKELSPQVAEAFKGVDLILHAGDLIALSVLDWLEQVAPVLAARGNGDAALPPSPRLKETQVLAAEGKRIGVCHCLPFLEESQERSLGEFMERRFGSAVDVIVFGDTHVATIESLQGLLLVNPGSPSFPRNLVGMLGTIGMLHITGGVVEARIMPLLLPHHSPR